MLPEDASVQKSTLSYSLYVKSTQVYYIVFAINCKYQYTIKR